MEYGMKNPMILAVALIAAVAPVACAVDTEPQKAVLVTGASSGIGRNIAEHLAELGYFVYAGARKDRDIEELNAIDNIQAVRLDVTVQSDIDAAVGAIRAGGKGLYGLVNNAGVASLGAMTQVADDDMDFLFNVNIYGVVRVTQAFAPMILEENGRITTIGSISGFISGVNDGVYSMSKFAMEAFTDSLAEELGPQGVQVSIVEPGSFRTRLYRKTAERELRKVEAAGKEVTEEDKQKAEGFIAFGESRPEPDAVAAAVEHALFSSAPKRRYMVTPDQGQAEVTMQHAIRRIAELNHDHEFSYSRDELVNMLDEALGAL
jgi:NAD(P)-dependent dehydrogenase (short-subunit alcohol dehydrogenase family)